MMDDKKMEALLKETADIYNPPPEIPRERMWERIDAARAPRRGRRRPGRAARILRHPGFVWPVAAAAVLLLGIAIGRFSLRSDIRGPAQGSSVAAESPRAKEGIYGSLTAAVFAKAEALLTDVCSSGEISDPDNPLPVWAGSLLIQTRLLLDTNVAEQSDVKLLLEDLELVLAQIVQAGGSSGSGECEWIIGGMERRATLTRLRTRNLAGKSSMSL